MPSFVPPIAPQPTPPTAGNPTRVLLDGTGHRTLLVTQFTGTGVRAVAPIASTARVRPVSAGAITEMIELTPLPTANRDVLGRIGSMMPRFYIGTSNPITADPAYSVGQQIVSGPSIFIGATLGVLALSPREWSRVLVEAMAAGNEPDLDQWAAFRQLLGTDPALYILDHTGQVADGMRFDVEFSPNDRRSFTVDHTGDLASAAQDPILVPGVRVRMSTPSGGIPYHTAFRSNLRSSAEPDAPDDQRWFTPTLFADGVGTLLCTDLNGWFAARPPDVSLPRYYTGNRVEPLLDGLETLDRIWQDAQRLLALGSGTDTPFGMWFACWAFKDMELVPGVEASKFVTLVNDLVDKDVSVRLLASKLVNFDGSESMQERQLMVIALAIATMGLGFSSLITPAVGKGMSVETWTIAHISAMILACLASTQFVDAIESALDGSKDVVEALTPSNAADPRFALWSRYPSRFSDNPRSADWADEIEEIANVERIGVWHNKMQMLAVPGTGGVPEYIGYLGGIDINTNRTDSWGHRWPTDYHDVHARITGPAVADLFQTFYERYEYDRERTRGGEGPAAPNTCPRYIARGSDTATVSLSEIPPAGDHIVQIARTLYRPAQTNAVEGFWFAPRGEATVHDAILRAIQSAREYIYIEDQFMVPPDNGGQSNDEIIEALQAAASRCRALIMVFPEGTQDKQWLFGVQRRNMLMHRLSQSWGDKFLPLMHVRPILPEAGRVSSMGRTVLRTGISESAEQMDVTNAVRVPPRPCWAWITGELVLVTGPRDLDSGLPDATLNIVRGPDGEHHDVWARTHAAGEPVTFSKLDDVFIHAKVMLVDDTYASIGSVNMNRRGMYHDGEISAQILPGHLRAAEDNPVLDIRCRIWGDHLGLDPTAARAALADPLEALPLLRRDRAAGNNLVDYRLLDNMQPIGLPIDVDDPIATIGTVFNGIKTAGALAAKKAIWSTLIDPTTAHDPYHADPFAP